MNKKGSDTSYKYLDCDDYIIWRDCIRAVFGMTKINIKNFVDELGITRIYFSKLMTNKEHRVKWVMFYASMYVLMGLVSEVDCEEATKDEAYRMILKADYAISQHRKEVGKHEGK